MDEVVIKRSFRSKVHEKILGLVITEPISFSSKKSINFRGLGVVAACLMSLFFLVVFLMPVPEEQTKIYNERKNETSGAGNESGKNASSETKNPLDQTVIQSSLPHGGSQSPQNSNLNTAMVIPRENDSSTTLPPGTKFSVRLVHSVTATTRAMPVIGILASSVESSSSVAIPEDAQIFGDAVLDGDASRVSITWKSILFPDGRSKALAALALGSDNQAGVEGDYHSDAVKNTAGQMVSRFIGGFAEGAISHGPLGASDGGVQNGILQGAADTAKDRTQAWSEDLKKPNVWIELPAGTTFQVILTQPFIYRDPEGAN